jgi:hypothetical protein
VTAFKICDLGFKIYGAPRGHTWPKILNLKSYIVIFTCIILAFNTFAQVKSDSTKATPSKADSVKRPVRTKTSGPVQQLEKSRIGSSVVDDSTRNPYGPSTTRWSTEREMFTAKTNFRPLDTSINNYHRWTYVQKLANFYHDLGNNGTALNPIFPVIPSSIGASAGWNGFAPYWNEELKFYDTKSPYTRMYLVWGGQGRAATRIEYSRNINPKWNISFNYRPILTDKQVLRQGKADRNVISNYYDFYTHYTTKDDRYKIVASYQRIRHRVIENGGLAVVSFNANSEPSFADYFGQVNPNLLRASSFEQHNKFHVFHQFNVKKIQAYHIADLETQINWFRDDLATDPETYFDYNRIDSVKSVLDSTRFRTFSNQVGIKGQIGKNNNLFYNGWLKFRSYELYNKYMRTDTLSQPGKALEKYVGGEIQYALDSIQHITGLIEVLNGGYSRIESTGHMKWFDFNAIHRISKPTMLQTAYAGHFDAWNNDFKAQESLYLSAFPKVRLGWLFLSPGVTYTAFKNYIYYKKYDLPVAPPRVQRVLWAQTASPVSYVTPQVSAEIRFLKKMFFRPQVLYTRILTNSDDDALRMPSLFMNGQLAFEGTMFKGAIDVQVGVDAHWHSSYWSMGYDPVTQTFYNTVKESAYNTQDIKPPAYLLTDIFINGRIKRGRFFLKYHNLTQKFTKVGYMPTPYYRGVPSILDFGFELMLFD